MILNFKTSFHNKINNVFTNTFLNQWFLNTIADAILLEISNHHVSIDVSKIHLS